MLTREQVIEVLKTVEDPELFIDIWFLGLVYGIELKDESVEINMTLTSPMCPAGTYLIDQIKTKLTEAGAKDVRVNLVFSPPWQPSDEVKAMLGII